MDRPDQDERADDESPPEHTESGADAQLAAAAEQRGRRLQRGRSIGFFGGELPLRALIAAAIFVVAFLAVWALLWQLGLGLGLGWLPGLAAGAVAAWLYAGRFEPGPERRGER